MVDLLTFLYDWGIPILILGFVFVRYLLKADPEDDLQGAPPRAFEAADGSTPDPDAELAPLPVFAGVRVGRADGAPLEPLANVEEDTNAEEDTAAASAAHVNEQGNCSACGESVASDDDEPLEFCFHCGAALA